jgi:hypothetical protein
MERMSRPVDDTSILGASIGTLVIGFYSPILYDRYVVGVSILHRDPQTCHVLQ